MLRASRAMLWVVMMMVVLVVRAVAGQSDDALPPVPKDPSDPPAPAPAAAAPEECFSAGSVAGAVVGTFAATLILLAAAALLYKFYWRGRRGKHLILTKDPEGGADQFAFDNPCFRDGSPLARSPPEKDPNRIDQKAKWSGWPSLAALAGGTKATGEKRRALDDSCIASGEALSGPVRVVALRSRDFTGLGFNVCGNMRDGIFVRDVQHRGPAFESGRVQPGDRIEAVRISFRHMVFEDALTILSYASPYEVQLELGSAPPAPAIAAATPSSAAAAAAAAAAGSLLRPRRAGTAAAAAGATTERIVHPLFRSHSSADLAQINKASLRRVQQMNVLGNAKNSQPHATDEAATNEYPTLKLSSSPTHPPKEAIRLEKTAPTAVVKPERVKRASTPKEPDSSPTSDSGTLNKFQKFGVRVLPDPAPRQTTENKPATIEAEKHQNEQNLIKERVATNPFTDSQGHDTVDTEMPSDASLHYDERGIDVGPVEMLNNSSHEHKSQQVERQYQRNATHEEEDWHKENNVKHLLTKGLQNLKEKLHHDKRSSGSPESPQRIKDKKQKPARQHKTSMSSDSEGLDGERPLEGALKSKMSSREEPEKIERKRQRNPEKEIHTEPVLLPPGSGIPSEIPEEVQRAAAAARSNRKSLQPATYAPLAPAPETREKHEAAPTVAPVRENISDSSSDEGGNDGSTDSSGRPPKRSNKRKAPLPPAEDAEHTLPNGSQVASKRETDQDAPSTKESTAERDANAQSWSKGKTGNFENVASKTTGENGTAVNSLANLARQKNTPEVSGKDITNITIDDRNSNVLCSLTSRRSVENDNGGQANSFPVDSSSSGTSTMETKTVDYDDGIHVSTVNSDSDSDLERLEGDEEEYDRKRGKKGGTTIELNSSHITIHHSPSSDTMQMAAELESDSTRKAASLGDLSRLDSEQPMSILERAVSLDLGDGGTPHSSKKRKAPLPPPGEEYHSAIQDTDDGGHYRKEPRLDNAMDTFQRRRLKKSSDWGTLEEALKQTDTSVIPSKASNTETVRMEVDLPKQKDGLLIHDGLEVEIPNLADDQKVKLSGLSQKFSAIVRAEAINLSGIEPLESSKNQGDKSDNAEQSGRSSPECDHTVVEQEDAEAEPAVTENLLQKKTVLHVSPEPTKKSLEMKSSVEETSVSPSQVTIASSSLLALRRAVSEPSGHEVTLSTAPEQILPAITPRIRTGNIISSTPLPNRERTQVSHISPNSNSSIMDHSYIRDSLQSPLVTSSDAGVSNIHVVSSTSQDPSTPPEIDSSLLVSSATDHFVTAASFVDSTSAPEEMSDNEDMWENDLQPPELPTSPVPILAQASTSSFAASPSMTYITEIQVVTTTDSDSDQTIGSSNLEVTHNGAPITSSFTPKGIKNKPDTTLQSDSTSNVGAGVIKDRESNTFKADDNLLAQLPRSSVTVTSIRTSESASGQGGGTVTETTSNHVPEKKPKSMRPPVPPRKSDLSSPSPSPPSMSSSTIMVEVPKIRLAETASSSLLAGGSVSQINPAAAGKFISFSSLSPRTDGGSTRHGSSFEQWVFLDDSSSDGHQNGYETSITDTENGQHASVMTLPGLTPNRSQTVTHIILDTKQNSGGQVQE